jgi:flagellar hook-associated protein FlgK
MHYLLEHYGETGAEAKHEQNAIEAVASVLNDENKQAIKTGVDDFLNSLAALWDLLDSALLESGNMRVAA